MEAAMTAPQSATEQSGFHLISRGNDALIMRLAMIANAEHSIDIQYYSMQSDITGKLLLEAILRAADRGVKVRILIDALNLNYADRTWSLLNLHPNIQLRSFNPIASRFRSALYRFLAMFTQFNRLTKRMHNKVFIADCSTAIIGGRNLGDAYFGSNLSFNFRDIDVFCSGPITQRICKSFNAFWDRKESYPLHILPVARPSKKALEKLRLRLKYHWQWRESKGVLDSLPQKIAQLAQNELPMVYAHAELAADPPSKIEQPREAATSKPKSMLEQEVAYAEKSFCIVSPYFVPGLDGLQWLRELVQRGVKLQVLTNSLASTDAPAVHTGYRRYREALIAAGVQMYEMKPLPGSKRRLRSGRFKLGSRASLHTKVYIIDDRELIIGTFNMDPRSIELNTEIAIVIHSPELAMEVRDMFNKAISPAYSYHVVQNKQLEWITEELGKIAHFHTDPNAGLWRRLMVALFSLLPLENQL